MLRCKPAFSLINSFMTRKGFTLIELLVVVSIIVVLLALLMPAMDKAVYQAELTACSGKLKAMSVGVLQYAFENKRYYPDRKMAGRNAKETGRLPFTPNTVYAPGVDYDMRPIHSKIFSINKMLQCPLSDTINLENTDIDQVDIALEASYMMFWSWQMKEENKTF